MMRIAFLLGLLALASVGVAGENLCLNGDLEKGAEGWSFPDSSYRVEKGAGIDGSSAIVFEANKWKKHEGPRYEIAARPGRVYRFSGRIKRDTITNVVQVVLVRLKKDHGWITQVIAEKTGVNAVDNGGWDLFEGETAFLDPESQILRLYLYIRDGACGKFRADDFRIEELPEDPLGDLQSSGYRNAAVSGPVTFAVPVRVNPVERRIEDLRATLKYADATGAQRDAAMKVEGGIAKVTLDAASFAAGTQTLVATLADATGASLDTASLAFTRLASEPDHSVRVDGHRRFIVRGKPFFPICITWGTSIKRKDWETAMAKFRNGPFNVAMVYEHELTPKDLDFFQSNGLMVKYNLKDVYTGFTKVHPPSGVKTVADEVRYVTEKVNLLKDHPGLFAWYINDEFPPTMAGRVKERCALLNRLDPTHPVSVCLDRPFTIGAFNGGFDIISSDPYPIGNGKPLSIAADWTRTTDEQVFGLKPMMQTVQAFDWSWFQGNWKNPHFPSYDEMRSMTWQQIAEGATGVGYFSYSCIYANLKDEAFDRAWGDTCRVAEEVKALSPVLLSLEPAPQVAADRKSLSVRTWRHGGKVYLVACDLTGKASAPRLQVPGRYAAASCRDGAEATLAADGALELKLPPNGVAIVRLTPGDPAGGNLCLNGDLEKGTEGWSFPDPVYRVEKGAGVNGSAAIVFEAHDGRKHVSPHYEIAAKPGRVYRFSGRARCDTFTNAVRIALVRLTKDRRWITQVVATRTDDNAVDNGGWARFEGETAYLDAESQVLRLYFDIRKGSCGRFRADDFRIEELPLDPLGDLQSSGYRNAAAAGPVTFAVPVRVNPAERKPENLKVDLAYADATGAKRMVSMRIEGDDARVTLDTAALAPGSQTLVATLTDGGATLDTASLAFTRLAADPDYPVRVDGHRRFIVRGKPFFPIGIYWGTTIKRKDWVPAMAKFRNGPFNVALVYEHELTPKDLDFFASNGMMVQYNLKDVYTGFPQVRPPRGVETVADEIRYVTEKVNLVKDHPGLFAWYVNDEFPAVMADRVRERCALLNRLDPTHPVSICLCAPFTVGAFNGGFDIISTDPYPVGNGAPQSNAALWTRTTDAQVLGLKPMMQTLQAFDWSWFGRKGNGSHFPSYDEMRAMTWQQIAEGATGVGYFSYSSIYANLKDEAFDRAWGDTCRVAEEVKALSPVLLSLEPAPQVAADRKSLSVRTWRHGGKVYLVACDLTGKASAPRLQVPGRYAAASCRDGAEATLAADGALELKLPPNGVALVCLTPEE